ncbi:protein PSK SIMULATOR 3-like [Raphanus sativus]|uniref:Protein PSK SIMULATOR 3-like n=1 Tax=Raphanus sativus TaxID=3726 RepID=A0A9W3DT74_RAPSA|nr:protein PSK SIMULATOR 3-like [Raphanus sativus]
MESQFTNLENSLRKHSSQIGIKWEEDNNNNKKVMNLQQKIERQRQHVKYLKDRSLWNKSFGRVDSRQIGLHRTRKTQIRLLILRCHVGPTVVSFLPRSLSSSSSSINLVHPSPNDEERLRMASSSSSTFLEESSRLLKPPETTLGGSGSALHYANLIVVMENMIKQLQLVGLDARDDLYSMLPVSVRSSLRSRLKGVGFTATDGGLAVEWKAALN